MFWFFGREAGGILAPQSGVKPTSPASEDKVLPTGPPGKSLQQGFDLAKQTWSWNSEQASGWGNSVVLAELWEAEEGVA